MGKGTYIRSVSDIAQQRYRMGLFGQILGFWRHRHLLLCGLRQRIVQLRCQVCELLRLAQFLQNHTPQKRYIHRRSLSRHAPHRGGLWTLSRTPWPHIWWWPSSYWQKILYEFLGVGFWTEEIEFRKALSDLFASLTPTQPFTKNKPLALARGYWVRVLGFFCSPW